MQDEQQPSETWNVSDSEVEKNSFDRNNAPIIKDASGSITINYYTGQKAFPACDLDTVKDENSSKNAACGDKSNDNKVVQNRKKLNDLLTQKRDLEIKLERVESEINRIELALKDEANPSLTSLLHWLSGRKHLSEKYGKIVLRGFQNLKQEAESEGNLDDFYFQIEHYLELIYLSFSKDKKLFLQEPGIPPTFADFDTYEHASQEIYKEVFRVLKENIPQDNVEHSLRSKLEDHFDELLKRLQAYF